MHQQEYQKTYTVGFGEVDCHGMMRPSGFSGIFQDMATWHSAQLGISGFDLNVLWVLTRLMMDVARPVRPRENLHCTTWCAGLKGASWLRSYEITDDRGEVVATATTAWVMLDVEKQQILRPSKVIANYQDYLHPERPLGEMPEKLHRDDLEECRSHRVSYTDLDVNNHLNNSKIVDIISDALEINLRQGTFLTHLQVNFLAQTKYDQVLILSRKELDETKTSVVGNADGEVKFQGLAGFLLA